MGALDAQRVVHQRQGWRLISCMLLHAGVFHVLANMLSLVFIGIWLEQEFGFALFMQYGISVGACGALFGLLGSTLSELYQIGQFSSGILPHVDNFAHIGGFVSGFFLGFLFLIRPQFNWLTQRNAPLGRVSTPVKSKHNMYQYVLWVLSLVLLIVGYTLGLVTLFRGDLRNIKHRNLVKIITACSSFDSLGNDFKALVYEYMEKGSLEKWLHPPTDIEEARGAPKSLNLLQRLSISIDDACALD